MSKLNDKLINVAMGGVGCLFNNNVIKEWVKHAGEHITNPITLSVFKEMENFLIHVGEDKGTSTLTITNDFKINTDRLCSEINHHFERTLIQDDFKTMIIALLLIHGGDNIIVDHYANYMKTPMPVYRLSFDQYALGFKCFNMENLESLASEIDVDFILHTKDLCDAKMCTLSPLFIQNVMGILLKTSQTRPYLKGRHSQASFFNPNQQQTPMPGAWCPPQTPFNQAYPTQDPNSSDAPLLSELQHRLNVLSQQIAAIQQEQFNLHGALNSAIQRQPGMSAQHPMHTSGQMSVSNRMDPSPSFQQWTQRGANHTFKL